MFSWDARKAQLNYEKHWVAFEEAATVFAILTGWTGRIQNTQSRSGATSASEGR